MKTIVNLIKEASQANDLDSDAFNDALAAIQGMIGQADGGFAGVWFSEYSLSEKENPWAQLGKDERASLIIRYIKDELQHCTLSPT
jgi:hypothetical protein